MDDKLKESVEALVSSIFSEKEEADIRNKTEDALKKSAETINELTTSLEDKNSEVEEQASNILKFEEEVKRFESELEAAKKETEEVSNKVVEAETLLDDMRKDKAAEERFSVLEVDGVARVDKKEQLVKIREMSDDEFVSYKDELVALRATILAELKANKDDVNKDDNASGDNSDNASSDDDASGSDDATGDLDTTPVQVSAGKAIAAAMNFEITPSDDTMKRYADLGKAMAESMSK